MGHFFICSFFLKIEDTKIFIIPLFNIVGQVGVWVGVCDWWWCSGEQYSIGTSFHYHYDVIQVCTMYYLKDSFVILTLIFGTDMYNCEVYSNNRKESQMFNQVLRPPQTFYVDWLNLFFRFLIFTSLLNYFNSIP